MHQITKIFSITSDSDFVLSITLGDTDENLEHSSSIYYLDCESIKATSGLIREMLNLSIDVNNWLSDHLNKRILKIEIKGSFFLSFFLIKSLLLNCIKINSIEIINPQFLPEKSYHIFKVYEKFVQEVVYSSFSYFPNTFVSCDCSQCNSRSELPIIKDTLSVIIPTKNVDKYIVFNLIKSITPQLKSEDELILIDDNSFNTFESYELHSISPKIRLVKGNNIGISNVRNLGITESRNDLVLFIDSDDKISPNFITIQRVTHLKYPNITATGVWLKAFGSLDIVYPQWDGIKPLGIARCLPPAGILMWKRSQLKSLSGFEEDFYDGFEDFDLVAKAISHSMLIVVFDYVAYFYQRGHKSLSQSWSLEREIFLHNKVQRHALNLCFTSFSIYTKLILEFGSRICYGQLDSLFLKRQNSIPKVKSTIFKLRLNPFLRPVWNQLPYFFRNFVLKFLKY